MRILALQEVLEKKLLLVHFVKSSPRRWRAYTAQTLRLFKRHLVKAENILLPPCATRPVNRVSRHLITLQ